MMLADVFAVRCVHRGRGALRERDLGEVSEVKRGLAFWSNEGLESQKARFILLGPYRFTLRMIITQQQEENKMS